MFYSLTPISINYLMAIQALPPVASIGSTKMTLNTLYQLGFTRFSETFLGIFL